MRPLARRLLRSNAAFAVVLALLFVGILRSVAENQSPVEALLWIGVILAGLILMVEGLVRGYPSSAGRVVSGRTLEEIRRGSGR